MRHLRLFVGILALMIATAIHAAVGKTFKNGVITYTILTEDTETATGTVSGGVANSSSITELFFPATVANNDIVYTVTEVGNCNNNSKLKKVTFDENSQVAKISGNFYSCTSLEEISFPATLTYIGGNAFYKDANLTVIHFPDGLKTIGSDAFRETGISNVYIPASVTSINSTAFSYCPVTSMEVNASNKKYKSMGNCILSKNGKTLVTGGANPTIPDGVTSISKSAFEGRPGVTAITIPETCTTIGDKAFLKTDLTSIYIPQSITSIGTNAFGYTQVHSVYVDDLATYLKISTKTSLFGSDLWSLYVNNEKIEELMIPDEITTLGEAILAFCPTVEKISYNTFAQCDNLETVILPETMTSLGTYCFGSCDNLKNITLPAGITTIPSAAFEDCTSLETLVIPDDVTSIEASAFHNSALKNVIMSNNVQTIGNNAFQNCNSLEVITLPSSLTTIGTRAFKDCDNLTTVINETSSLTALENEIFMNCPKLEFITLNAGIKKIGMDVFANDSTLRSIKIPNSVVEINQSSGPFKNCKSLSHITMPSHLGTKPGYMAVDSKCTEFTIPAYCTSGNTVLCPIRNPENNHSIFYMGDEAQLPWASVFNKDEIHLYVKKSVFNEKYPNGIPSRYYSSTLHAYDTIYWPVSYKIPVSMTNASGSPIEYKTLCRDFDVDLTHTNDNLPEGVEPLRAYLVEDVEGELRMVFLNEIKYIPSRLKANVTDEDGNLYQGVDEYVGVILRGTPGYTYYYEMGEHDYTQGAEGQWLMDDAMEYSNATFEQNLMAGDANDDFYVYKTVEDDDNNEIVNYGLNNGRFKIYNKNGWLNYNKSYLQLPKDVSSTIEGDTDAQGNANLTFVFQNADGTTDKVSSVEFHRNCESDIFYNPYGQRVNANTKGVVINNGRKFVNK